MRRRRWFLPEQPDVLGILREQAAVTLEGIEALAAWARGDEAAGERLRELEHRADERKRELRAGLAVAFTTPLDPEDVFEISRELDRVLNDAKNVVREAAVMHTAPDEPMAQMAAELAAGTARLVQAVGALGSPPISRVTEAADDAAKSQSRLEKIYRRAMSGLIGADDLREVAARRELYRRLSRASERLRDVAERLWYSVLKEG